MEVSGDVTMETNKRQTTNDKRKVKIELVSHLTKDCWTADFRKMARLLDNKHTFPYLQSLSLFVCELKINQGEPIVGEYW